MDQFNTYNNSNKKIVFRVKRKRYEEPKDYLCVERNRPKTKRLGLEENDKSFCTPRYIFKRVDSNECEIPKENISDLSGFLKSGNLTKENVSMFIKDVNTKDVFMKNVAGKEMPSSKSTSCESSIVSEMEYALAKAMDFNDFSLVFKTLMDHQLDYNFQCSSSGRTVLMVAAYHGRYDVIDNLLMHHLDIHLKDHMNQTAKDYATISGNLHVWQSFVDCGRIAECILEEMEDDYVYDYFRLSHQDLSTFQDQQVSYDSITLDWDSLNVFDSENNIQSSLPVQYRHAYCTNQWIS